MHEEAYNDSVPLTLEKVDSHILDVRVLSALDLAVSKLSRFSNQDRQDIISLAKHGLIDAGALRIRAEQSAGAYVGNLDSLQTSIRLACRIVEDVQTLEERRGRV